MSSATRTMTDGYQLDAVRAQFFERVSMVCAGIGGLLSIIGLATSARQFFFSYLVAVIFCTSIALGALFWTMLHHLTDAGWSVVIRRVNEQLIRLLPWLALGFLPVVLGLTSLYDWTNAEKHATNKLWLAKHSYLNVTFFLIRMAVYFGIWSWLALRLAGWSRQQDHSGDVELTRRMQGRSAPGMLLLALTTSFAAFDWIMSLEFEWVSTMFGVYFWAGSILSSMALLTLLVLGLRQAGVLAKAVTPEHLQDMGKLLFGFTVFWTYIAFCQYFLIWYGNLEEETPWYGKRLLGSWSNVTLLLCIGHFFVPFFLLIGRHNKRTPPILALIVCWILFMHYVDLYLQIMPVLHERGATPHWLDAATLLGLVGGLGLVLLRGVRATPLIPVRDPRLSESLHFHNT